jgi:hypothetical protein
MHCYMERLATEFQQGPVETRLGKAATEKIAPRPAPEAKTPPDIVH